MKPPFLIFVLLHFGVFSLGVDSQLSPPPSPPPPSSSPPPPPPPWRSPPPPSPPPPIKAPHPPDSRNTKGSKPQHRKRQAPPPPPPSPENLNFGKKLGFIFVGLAGVLQICVVAFLLIRRHHLIKTHR